MKPLKLKIMGINSFIEEEIVDFEELTSLGLFGIFGPTGSGKSTILDAITLALYGEMPRSGKNLSGIVNSNSDRASVDYEFMIGSKGNKKSYHVHRSYRKDKEGNVTSHAVKLYDMTDKENPQVLEERVTGVNNAIEEIIGLKGNDFTRSVVLPQGNFSEFLKLGGRDRRDMLERIFALQDYGSKLTMKVNVHKRQLRDSFNFIEGELKAYEGVSKENFESLKEEIKALDLEYQEVDKKYEKIQKEYEEKKELYQLTREFNKYNDEKKKLDEKRDEIEAHKKAYDLAERALHIKPFIDQKNKLESRLKGTEEEKKEKEEDLEILIEALEKTEKNFKEAEEKRDGQIPKLQKERGQMEDALEKSKRLASFNKKLEDLKKEGQDLQKQIDEEDKKYQEIDKEIESLISSFREDKDKLERLQISPEYSKSLYRGQGIEENYKKSLREEESLASRIKALNLEISPLEKEKEDLGKVIKNLEEDKEKEEKALKELVEKIDHIENENMAAKLAFSLEEGQSCPVCGSKDHPLRAEFTHGEGIEGLKEEEEKIKIGLKELESALIEKKGKLQAQIGHLGGKKGNLSLLEENYQELKKIISDQKETYHALVEELNLEDLGKAIKDLEERNRQADSLQKSIKSREDKRDGLRGENSKRQNFLSEKRIELTKISENIRSIGGQAKELKEEIERFCGEKDPSLQISIIDGKIKEIEENYKAFKNLFDKYSQSKIDLEKIREVLGDRLKILKIDISNNAKSLEQMIKERNFENIEKVEESIKSEEEIGRLKEAIDSYREDLIRVKENLDRVEKRMGGRSIDEEGWKEIEEERSSQKENLESKREELIKKKAQKDDIERKLQELKGKEEEKKELEREIGLVEELESLFRGNAFVEFVSLRQLKYIAREASKKLEIISRGKYQLELDGEGNFIIRDDFNGGIRRGTQTLSGGETFLASLALALSLSSHIQLNGKVPLEFFFLDEGFGSLDSELLEIVMDSLERLHSKQLSVGLISHVEGLRERMPRKLIVKPAISGVRGTKLVLE